MSCRTRSVVSAALLLLCTLGLGARRSGQNATAELEQAKDLYRDARFGPALARFQSVLSLVEGQPGSEAIQEEAQFYIGLTLFALDEPEAAREAFREVLRLSPDRRLDPDVHAPRVVELFEAARSEMEMEMEMEMDMDMMRDQETAEREAGPPSAPMATTTVPTDRSEPRLPWVALGAGVGAAGALILQSASDEPATSTVSSTSTSTTTTILAGTEVDYRVNGVKAGTFSCSSSILFTIDVINRSDEILRADGFEIEMTSVSPQCFTHRPAIDGTLNVEILPSGRAQVRQLDLSGDLCREPGRLPGCDWISRVLVTTGQGELAGEVGFSTIP